MDNGGDLAENVTCLGRCGIYKTIDGLNIGYLSAGLRILRFFRKTRFHDNF